jgi:NADPH:quinone reductase-like Zn-dependent oxidoreductase
LIVGSELSGEIVALGSGINDLKVGQRVFAGLSHKGGACAQLASVNRNKVIPIPDELSYELGSTLAIAGVTPLQAFTIHYPVKPGDVVLVNGASGGVGMYAVQIAKLLGARVIAVCSAKNTEFVKSLGADEVIDYNQEDFRQRINSFDVVLDAAANAFFPEAKKCLKKGGMLIKLNMSIRSIVLQFWTRMLATRKLKMILLKNRQDDLQWLMNKIVNGEIKVEIETIYPLEKTREAHERSQSGRVRGKLVIRIQE